MTSVPGGARRLLRDRPRLVAVGLLAVTAVAASTLQTTAATVLQQTLDENWRGTYDILVTQRGKDPVTAGLLRSDAIVDAAGGRLSMDDLALIRGLPGVEVAAPIAEVSFAEANLLGQPLIWLPVPVRADASLENPQAFRVTVTSSTDDGVGARALSSQQLLAFAYQPSYSQIVFDSSGAPLIAPDGTIVYATTALADSPRLLSGDSRVTFTSGNYDQATGTIPLGVIVAPRPAANVALVDPVAERALLGDAGSFLDPLVAGAGNERLPIVVLDRAPPTVNVVVQVEQFTEVTPGVGGAEAVEQAQGTGFLQNGQIAPRIDDQSATSLVGDYHVDVSDQLSPYRADEVLVGGMTTELVDETQEFDNHPGPSPRSVLGARYLVTVDVADTAQAEMAPRGYSSYGRFVEAPVSGDAPAGSVTDYSKLFGSVGQRSDVAPELADRVEVVGSFSPDELRAVAGAAGFMPLGGYDIASPTLSGGASLATSVTGFGIPGTNELAIASFDLLDGWNVDRPISAIRIRVAGIGAYNAEAQQKLLTAASALERLGFEATIVAGSSPQPVSVLVRDYAMPVDAQGVSAVADLGRIEQHWSRLGAVTEADAAVSATSVALLAVSVLSVGVLLAVVQLGSVPARRAQAGVLRQLGWRRRRIARWLLSEELVALLLVAAVGAIAVALASAPAIATVAVGVSLALVIMTSLAAVLLGARAPRHTVRRQRARPAASAAHVTGPVSFGARLARSQPAHSVSLGLAVLLIVVSVAIGAAVFVQGRQLAGPSVLGAVASARAWVPQGMLAAASLAAGITLAVLSRRMGLDRRREQWVAIRAMGWSRSDVTRAHLAELAFSAAPGALGGLGVAIAVAVQVPGLVVPVVVASLTAALVAIAVVLFSGRRLD